MSVEREAQAEAETLLKPLVKRLRATTDYGYREESYVEYWAAVKVLAGVLASRTPVAAPSDTDTESLIAEARSVLTRAMNRSEDRAPGEDRSSWYAKALVDAGLLSRVCQPVQVEVTETMIRDALESYLSTEGKVRDAMRAALSAALGGGDQ